MESQGYGCVRRTRNGPCRGRRLNRHIGPKDLTLCNKHLKEFESAKPGMLILVESDHDEGLHGEGDDRKQFAETHERGEFYVICTKCRDELLSEEHNVPPDQVQAAVLIKQYMTTAEQEEKRAIDLFMQRIGDKPSGLAMAIDMYGGQVVRATQVATYYRQAVLFSQGEHYWAKEGKYLTLTLVEAFDRVLDGVKEELLGDNINDDDERRTASRFVKSWEYRRA